MVLAHPANVGGLSPGQVESELLHFLSQHPMPREAFFDTIKGLLNEERIYLTAAGYVQHSNPYAPIILQRVAYCLEKLSKPQLVRRVFHCIQLVEENNFILQKYIRPHIKKWCEELKTLDLITFMMSFDHAPYPDLTMYLKAFHFNARMNTDESLSILRELAFLFNSSNQPQTVSVKRDFKEFVLQLRDGRIDYLNPNVLEAFKSGIDLLIHQRDIRNAMKEGRSSVYDRCFNGDASYVNCFIMDLKSSVFFDKSNTESSVISYTIPDYLEALIQCQRNIIVAMMSEIIKLTRHEWG